MDIYNQAQLTISIDKVKLQVNHNIATYEYVNDLIQSLSSLNGITVNLNNHDFIVYNKYGSSIATISNYLVGKQKSYKDIS